MADLGILLNKALPLQPDGSLPEPIRRDELEKRILELLYPSRRIGGRSHTYIDTALITGSVSALADFGLVRFTGAKGGGATRVGSDLVYRTVTDLGPARSMFGAPPGHGTRTAIVDEFGNENHFRVGPEAEAEIARIKALRRKQYIEKLRADLIETGDYQPA